MDSSSSAETPDSAPLRALSPQALAGILRDAGFRAVLVTRDDGDIEVHSASQGVGFFGRFGNAADAGEFYDFSLICAIAVETVLPANVVDLWNQTRRFGRAYRLGRHLMLSLDVSVDGGVTRAHVGSQCLLWDRLMQEFVLHLRQLHDAPVAS